MGADVNGYKSPNTIGTTTFAANTKAAAAKPTRERKVTRSIWPDYKQPP
jgi:hypothetical protein